MILNNLKKPIKTYNMKNPQEVAEMQMELITLKANIRGMMEGHEQLKKEFEEVLEKKQATDFLLEHHYIPQLNKSMIILETLTKLKKLYND